MCRRSKCYSCSPVACHLNRPLPLLQFFFIFEGQWIVLFDSKTLLSSKHIDHVCLVWLMISSCFPSFFFFNDKSQWQPSCFLGILFDGFCNLCCACPRAIPPSFFESLKWVWILIWQCYLSSLNEPLNCEFPPFLLFWIMGGDRTLRKEKYEKKERKNKTILEFRSCQPGTEENYGSWVHTRKGEKKERNSASCRWRVEKGGQKKELNNELHSTQRQSNRRKRTPHGAVFFIESFQSYQVSHRAAWNYKQWRSTHTSNTEFQQPFHLFSPPHRNKKKANEDLILSIFVCVCGKHLIKHRILFDSQFWVCLFVVQYITHCLCVYVCSSFVFHY